MAHKNRDKEYWLIPKRANLHQSIVLLSGILELQYNGKTWNGSKQDRLGAYLGRNGATKNGKTIAPQSLRTLLASIPQFLGFSFINTQTTPNTLFVTKVGYVIVDEFKTFLKEYDYYSLVEAKKNNGLIKFSETYLHQFLKLQITNPVILKDCEKISVFPLIYILKVLKKVKYLTTEELAYFIFKSKVQDEIDLTILEILNFRNLDYSNQRNLINAFKATHLGNISLVKAPSAGYFLQLCSYTGLIKQTRKVFNNKAKSANHRVSVIELETDQEVKINNILENYNTETYDFKDNLELWLQYIGDPEIFNTPKDATIINNNSIEQLVVIFQGDTLIAGDLVYLEKPLSFPVLEGNDYKICIYSKDTGKVLKALDYSYMDNDLIEIGEIDSTSLFRINRIELADNIIQHINSKNFSNQYSQYLKMISKFQGKELLNSKNLRGARLEFLFYEYFLFLEKHNIIDEVIWNGKIGQYGIPNPSPGGVFGEPDLIIFIDDIIIVVEVTTIKSKSLQWSAEGASVPDHIRLIEEKYPQYQIYALYMAPIIHHERVTKGMLSRLDKNRAKLRCTTINEFLKASGDFNNRADIKKYLIE